jgi:hypothetical protein
MRGQWLGRYQADTAGVILVDIDELDGRYLGYAVLRSDVGAAPIAFARFDVPRANQFTSTVQVFCLDHEGNVRNWSEVSSRYPTYTFRSSVQVNATLTLNQLELRWSEHGTSLGSATIPKSLADQPSQLVPAAISNWDQFKASVAGTQPYEFIFRGHRSNQWRLRTTFHRTGYANLEHYGGRIMNSVHRYMSAQTERFLDMRDPLQYGAFVTLLQHHGFPTPLLDWTYSPYVAAFFAYSGISKEQAEKADPNDRVRILKFNRKRWGTVPQLLKLAPLPPHISLLEALAIENKRLIPQQGLSTITNVDDIETYIQQVEQSHGFQYLEVIDLPVTERQTVMRELAIMGVTAGALFPGLDGTCAELRERFFQL